MSAAPGSMLWLLRHELRLQWRSTDKKVSIGVGLGILLVFLHLVAGLLAYGCRFLPPVAPTALLMGVTIGLALLFLMMVSTGIVVAVRTLYARGDMDLLLSSPLEPKAIIMVRGLAIAATVCGGSCVLVLPFANMLALLVTAKWLMAYVVLLCLAALGTGASLVLAHGLFRLLGPRRARVFAQIFAGILAAIVPLLFQIPNALPAAAQKNATNGLMAFVNHGPGPDSWLWFPARAFIGEPAALAVVVILCFGLFAWATVGLAGRLIGSAVAAAGSASAPAPARSGKSRRFRTGTRSVMRRKELRLIVRDPWVITQIGQQMIFVVPLGLLLWQKGTMGVPLAWLMLILIAGMLGAGLAWLAVSGEDAPDLLAASPLPRFEVLRAKLEAVGLLVGAALLVPIAVAWRADAWVGFTLTLCCAGSVFSGALLHVLFPSQGKRSEFNKRAKGRAGASLTEVFLAFGWALTGFLMLRYGAWALVPALLLLPLPAAGWMFK
jgi:ABC-2 type transport system permease protein